MIAQARCGTGKTVAYAVCALEQIDYSLCDLRQEPRCPSGHYFKPVFSCKPCYVCQGCNGVGCATPKIPAGVGDCSSHQRGTECTACGCTSEFDSHGDRICWCDTCSYGCIPEATLEQDTGAFEDAEDEYEVKTQQGVYCKKCAWYLCKGCHDQQGGSLLRPISIPKCQVLVIVPTRELANQVQKDVAGLGRKLGVRCHSCIGGTSVRGDIDSLSRGQHIVVGNPGRIFDMISKRHLRVSNVKLLVIDEADVLLSPGHKEKIYDIFKCMPPEVQCALFSSVMPSHVLETAAKFMRDPVKILARDHNRVLPIQVRHFYMIGTDGEYKVNRLVGLWGVMKRCPGVMVFCKSRRMVDMVAEGLANAGLTASCIHAELDQKERDLVMREFRNRSCKVLICTQEFGRGLNVPHVRLVVNFDMPGSPEEYLIRSGRCGRFGRSGLVVTFVSRQELPAMHDVAHFLAMRINETTMHAVHESLQKQPEKGLDASNASASTPRSKMSDRPAKKQQVGDEMKDEKCNDSESCKCVACVNPRVPGASFHRECSNHEQGTECIVCGCSAELDSYGDRICWCDSCRYGCHRHELC